MPTSVSQTGAFLLAGVWNHLWGPLLCRREQDSLHTRSEGGALPWGYQWGEPRGVALVSLGRVCRHQPSQVWTQVSPDGRIPLGISAVWPWLPPR